MPIYEYRCRECGTDHEILQKLSDAPALECPACKAPGLSKSISAAGFRLAGAGWYETDFKSGDKKNLSGDAAAPAAAAPQSAAPACGAGACPACE